jgi:hypothetical protein
MQRAFFFLLADFLLYFDDVLVRRTPLKLTDKLQLYQRNRFGVFP